MTVAKVTVSIEADVLKQLDLLVSDRVFANRSQAMGSAVKEKIERLKKTRLARACEMLDPQEEQAAAEIGVNADLETWPEY